MTTIDDDDDDDDNDDDDDDDDDDDNDDDFFPPQLIDCLFWLNLYPPHCSTKFITTGIFIKFLNFGIGWIVTVFLAGLGANWLIQPVRGFFHLPGGTDAAVLCFSRRKPASFDDPSSFVSSIATSRNDSKASFTDSIGKPVSRAAVL